MNIPKNGSQVKRGVAVCPFGNYALVYKRAGFAPIPVARSGAKAPLVQGITGYKGTDLTRDELAGMVREFRRANIGLRLDWDEIGIDVDAYDGRNGARTLARLEAKLGPLPKMWRSTSRMPADEVSGIYVFRAPRRDSWTWITNLGSDSGIEIIQRHHRFVTAAPSVHVSTGRVYGWWRKAGQNWTMDEIPWGDWPLLPVEWARYLRSSRAYAVPSVAASAEAAEWFRAVSGGPACEFMEKAARKGAAEIRSANEYGGLHDTMTRVTTYLCRSAAEGHRGLASALGEAEAAFLASSRRRGLAAEWAGAIGGAKAQAAAWRQSRADPCTELHWMRAPVGAR